MDTALFGAGCFWGVEDAFSRINGVVETAVGYAGGTTKNPTYEQVCSGVTGHAEVVRVTYDPAVISYDALLDVFWNLHDPTALNRQGPDIGAQYRSVIFYHTPAQEQAARVSKQELERSGKYRRPVVTRIEPEKEFFRAEEYHQKYHARHGSARCV